MPRPKGEFKLGSEARLTLADKVAHVNRASKCAAGHHCHWPGCGKDVPPAKWGCARHWFMLPKEIRDAIWAAYQPGQEVTKTPSREYVRVGRLAQDWIAANYPSTEGK